MGMISYVKQEIEVIRERDPAIKSNMEVFLYPSFKVILSYRVAHKLYLKKHYFWARWISQRAARKTGIEIHPGATIGKGLFIDHGTGVIIGETTIIGDNVTLYQGVTLGGTGKEQGKRHPTLKDNVMVSAGAHHNIIFQRWMTFSLFFSGTAKRNPLIQCYIISDDRSFSDDHTCSMIDKKSLSDRCSRMNLNPGLTRCSLRNPACPKIMLFQVKLMRHSVT